MDKLGQSLMGCGCAIMLFGLVVTIAVPFLIIIVLVIAKAASGS